MKTPSSGQTVFSLLRQFHEPRTVVHVGAGSGVGLLHQWREWPVEHALLIDADADRLNWVEPKAAGQPWQVVDACLTSADGEQIFYQASNPDESGLINPDQLKALWPNLHCTGQASRGTQRLDQILDQMTSQGTLWLLIDCFPALEILQGAGETLDRCGVLVARVLQNTSDQSLAAASLPAVNDFLAARGLRLVHVEAGTNPATAHAFFVRDWPAQLEEIITEHDGRLKEIEQLIQASKTLTADKESLQKQRDEQAKLAGEHQARLEAMTSERDQVNKDTAALRQQLEAMGKEKVELAAQHSAKVKEIEQLIQASKALTAEKEGLQKQRDEQAKLAGERQTRLKAVTVECDQVQKQNNNLQNKLEQTGKQMEQHENEVNESNHRQQLLQDELLKAEAQIELIKDLLLREPGL